MQPRSHVPRCEAANLPVGNDLIQAPLLLNIESVALAFFVIPVVHHFDVLDDQLGCWLGCASGLTVARTLRDVVSRPP
jgi:hypothetical protein